MNTHLRTQCRAPGKPLARLSVAALIILTGLAPSITAHAGPDDGRIITTKGHVDAPKAYWENGTFVLKNESNPYKTGADLYDLDKTVNWVGKGWDGRNGASQYTLTLPNSPSLGFLGEPGQTLYMAPTLTWGNHDPIWAGLGASVKIPTEQFRDGVFATDILSVDGPGRMELFRYNPDDGPAQINRILSSTSTGWHSWLLSKGSHTHNTTTFTRPGRYEVTYRTVARGTDGRIIQSAPQKLVWQVGGNKPILGDGTPTAVPTEERYNAANVGNLDTAKYVLSVAPHTPDPDPAKRRDADDKLSDITFTADDKNLKGKLTLYNNGYFLTDLDVTNGTATWSEMMGGESSHLQAVFTPEGDSGARWISHQLAYEPGRAESVYSDDGNGQWPVKTPEERNTTLNTATYTPASGDYTVRTVPSTQEGYRTIEVTFADPNFRGFIRGGFYAPNDYEYPKFDIETTVENGVARFTYREDSYFENSELIAKVLPHPDMNARASQVKLTGDYRRGGDYSASGTFTVEGTAGQAPADPAPSAPAGETPAPSSSPSATPAAPITPAPSRTEPTSPAPAASGPAQGEPTASAAAPPPAPSHPTCDARTLDGRRKIHDGHLDIQGQLRDKQLHVGLKDDSGLIDPDSTVRPLDSVVLTVSDRARRTRNEHMSSPALNFIGPVGTAFYGLPQTQIKGLPWPGYSTENIDYSQLSGGVKLHVVPRTMPRGARFGVFTESLTGADVLLDSTTGKDTIDIAYATHAHANWVFTEPGRYGFDVYYTATLKDGTEVKSEVQRMQVAVGDEAANGCSTGDSTGSAAPGASGGGTAAPSGSDRATPGAGTTDDTTSAPSSADEPEATAPSSGAGDSSPGAAPAPANNGYGAGAHGYTAGAGTGSDGSSSDGYGASANGGAGAAGSYAGGSGGSGTGSGNAAASGGSSGAGSSAGALAHTGFAAAGVAAVGAAALAGGIILVVIRRRSSSR